MKISPKTWCKIQETLANLTCPSCFSAKVKLSEDDKDNATCEDCSCKFTFDPNLADRSDY